MSAQTTVSLSWLVPTDPRVPAGPKERKSHDVVLVRPKDPTYAVECVGFMSNNGIRGLAACLAVCWQAGPSLRAPGARLEKCGYDVGKFGGQVFAELHARGIDLGELQTAGQAAVELLAGGLITEAEVKAIEGFTDPPGDPLGG